MTGLARIVVRILAILGKEIVETVRRPGAVLSLILGPFVILAVFGLGYQGVERDLNTIIVVQPSTELPANRQAYQAIATRGVRIVDVTTDQAAAEQELRNEQVDLLVFPPPHVADNLRAGRQSDLRMEMNITDPVEANYAGFIGETISDAVNRQIYKLGAQAGESYGLQLGNQNLSNIPPDVIAAPTRPDMVNIAPVQPTIVGFFGPAALALVLQHLAVTLVALSIVRERSSGTMDRFRVAPIRATELVSGKLAAFGLLGGAIAIVSIWLLVVILGVPILGSVALVALVVALLLVASLGLGLLISLISDSERQAVQLSLLTLLAAVFFSGFALRIDEFTPAVRTAAYALPVTHGIALLQDLMLRGTIVHAWQLAALAVIAAALLIPSWLLLRREMRPE
jgi:ABC-2 type transport system permease protein